MCYIVVLGVVGLENGHGFRFQRSGTKVDEGWGGCPWTAHVLFLGAVKNSPGLLDLPENVHVLFA